MYNLQRFLVDYDMALLRALAENRGVTLTTNRQSEAADQLAAALLDPLSVRTALARLSLAARQALETLLAAGGRMRAPQFARHFGQVRPVGPGRLEREAPWREPANSTEELWYAGLIFRAFQKDAGGPGEFIFVPNDLEPLLPQPQIEPPVFALETVSAPEKAAKQEPTLVHDLFAYLVHLQTHDVRPRADGRLGQRDRAALGRRLAVDDERRLALVRRLADRLGFVSHEGTFLRLEAAPVKRWLTAPPGRQLRTLQEAWRDDPAWNDLCRVPSLICDQKTPWRNDPVATRQAVLALLARCPVGEWWTQGSFVAAVQAFHPDFQRPDGDYTSWYIRDAESGEYLSGFESWERVEGALLADLLTGPLRWLGIVAVAEGKGGTVCRLSESGARFLGLLPDEPEEPASPPLVIRPDFRVELSPPVSLYTRFQLERFANLDSVEPCRYRLTVHSLGRMLSRGFQIEQVLAFLEQASAQRVPTNVAGQLRLWAGRFGQVQLEEVALLTAKSERTFKDLLVLPETRSLIARPLSPTSALVRKRDLARLRKALRELGYLPPEWEASDPTGHG